MEGGACWTRGEYLLAVAPSICGVDDRRHEVGHDDGALKLACNISHGAGQVAAIAQVDVPVVGAGEGQRAHNQWGSGGAGMLAETAGRV